MRKLILVILIFLGCSTFQKEGVYIKKAGDLSYFAIGSHNRISTGTRTDLGVGVPIEGIPIDVKVGGNGFLTSRTISIDEVDRIKYYEVASRNQDITDIKDIIHAIPIEFFIYDQTIQSSTIDLSNTDAN